MPELAGAVWAVLGFCAGCGFVAGIWVSAIGGLPRRHPTRAEDA